MPNCIICDQTTEHFLKCNDCWQAHLEFILHSREHDCETMYFFNLGIGSYDSRQSDQTWTDLASENLEYVCNLFESHLAKETPSNPEEWRLRIDNLKTQLKSRE